MSLVKTFLSALILETEASLALLAEPFGLGVWPGLGAHAFASVLFAYVAWRLAPANYRNPRWATLGVFASTGFFIPLGGLISVLALWLGQRFPKIHQQAVGQPVRLLQTKAASSEDSAMPLLRLRDARRALMQRRLGVDDRLRLLLAVQQVPPSAAVPLLQDLLGDADDDVRLLAYSMLENWEKTSSEGILRSQRQLERARTERNKNAAVSALISLAELNWWQVQAGLVRGDLRRLALQRCKDACEKILTEQPVQTRAWLIYVPTLLELGQSEAARRAVKLAKRAKMPRNTLLQLKVMVAYANGDWDRLRSYCQRFNMPTTLPSPWRDVAAFWARRQPLPIDVRLG